MTDAQQETVRAAGAVPWRMHPAHGLEVLVVHRPKYDDWTFPKGKLEVGESEDECAVREVEEETGLSVSLGSELPGTSYTDHRGRPKTVRYWAATVDDGEFAPSDEVDEVRWLAPEDAERLLSYGHDLDVLRDLGTIPELTERYG